ncbi:hypothetical protein [Halobaculum gomorrense]|uniref:hypothetical protein n=1 Tax=Halobaculum gomorrense TaxID=43928 RepID=UPI001161040A|nr:hypothetical protein [Halobaculum gomorrense]
MSYKKPVSTAADKIIDFEEATPRVVADLYNLDYEIRHVRDDVIDCYTEAEFENAYKIIIGQMVGGDNFRSIVGGQQLGVQTLIYEDIIAFIIPSERYEAIFATFDYNGNFPVNQFIQHVDAAGFD